uniref:Ribonuclease Z n=1 Tax=Melanthalia intermedia TaxID=172989 RepID=A0A345UAG6_9FLOR|nr:ribonuclease Z [Melanthalia intermedia]AXI97452.1 ribonuclease Z [Melanthalia intermedia]
MNTFYLKSNKIVLSAERGFAYCKLTKLKKIWLFNCSEGCQHYLAKKQIRINQISKIIIAEMNTRNTAGLVGLLSSLSLINKQSALHVYGPTGLEKYLELAKKYSQTSFRYNLYFHALKVGYIIENNNYQVFCFKKFEKKPKFEFILKIKEKSGKFKPRRAENLKIQAGPLYGKFKKGLKVILPDGITINGNRFNTESQHGKKISLIMVADEYVTRQHNETF